MKVHRKQQDNRLIFWAISGAMLLGMVHLLVSLWKLQVPRQGSFEEILLDQTLRRVRLPAIRGKIYDTHGNCLADTVPSYDIAIFTEELRDPHSAVANALELMHEIWARIGVKNRPLVSYQEIRKHLLVHPDQPLMVWDQLDKQSREKWKKVQEQWKGSRFSRMLIENDTNEIMFNAKALRRNGTSTAANTLELVYKIEKLTGLKREISFQDIKDHIYAQKPLPLLAWKNISEEAMAKWAESCANLTGTEINCRATRYYPAGQSLAHLIGFTMEADAVKKGQDGERIHFDLRGLRGKKGLEGLYDKLLQGSPGAKLVQVDVSGYHHSDLQTKLPKAGGDLILCIDTNIQHFAEQALTMHVNSDPFNGPVRGAVVVLNPNNGDVLAMVSSPSFDPNRYMIESSYRAQLMNQTNAPTYNRAVYGSYAPGSTFKPIAALGVLKEYPEYAHRTYSCRRRYRIGKRIMRCTAAHGEITLQQAIEHSCNIYMYQMVNGCAATNEDDKSSFKKGYDVIYKMGKAFGLGQVAGLFPDLNMDSDQALVKGRKYGNLPSKALNRVDAANLSIGQGAIQVAPLQMAMACAALANRGTLYRPRLIRKFRHHPDDPYEDNPTSIIRRIDVPQNAMALVRNGMRDVIMNKPLFSVGDLVLAGKTGTAEYGPKKLGKKNTWMISFAPFEQPRYAIAFIVEDGIFGGVTVAPRLKRLYEMIFTYDGTLKGEKI